MTIRISSPEDLLAALPYQVGFHPRDSIVVMTLRQGAVCFTARVDLPESFADADVHARAFTTRLRYAAAQAGGDTVVIIAYGDSPLARASLLAVGDSLSQAGLRILMSALVAGDQWRELGAGEPRHWGLWRDLPAAANSPCVAEFVGRGYGVAPDRASSLEALRPRPWTGPLPGARECTQPVQAATEWRQFFRLGPPDEPDGWEPSPQEALRLGRSLLDRDFRDALIALLVPGTIPLADLPVPALERARLLVGGALTPPLTRPSQPPWHPQSWLAARTGTILARFISVARTCPAPVSAGPYAVCALLAGASGTGHLCSAAVTAALIADPDHVLAGLLQQLLDHGLLPGHPVAGRPPGVGAA